MTDLGQLSAWLRGWHPWLRRSPGHFGVGARHRMRLRKPQGRGTSISTHRVRYVALNLDWRR